jgi:hypothetical protein
MIGIYQDEFIDYLKANFGENKVKLSSKNIIISCPWCEYQKDKQHYHLHIALEAPMFHCFWSTCEESGNLKKLIRKIEGHDISSNFVDKEKLKEYRKKQVFIDKDEKRQYIKVPQLNTRAFPSKDLYLRKRFKFSDFPLKNVKGLIFDVLEFINLNNIPIDEKLFKIKSYLQTNFVGFLTERQSMVLFRNIDESSSFKFYKLGVQNTNFIDYYRLTANNQNSKKIILSEGIFDIFTEYLFDILNLKRETKLYASVLSSKYSSLIKSIVYHEQIFRPDVVILSDSNIPLEEYKKLRYFNDHIINTLEVYYNKTGKDFNDTPITPVKYVVSRRRK